MGTTAIDARTGSCTTRAPAPCSTMPTAVYGICGHTVCGPRQQSHAHRSRFLGLIGGLAWDGTFLRADYARGSSLEAFPLIHWRAPSAARVTSAKGWRGDPTLSSPEPERSPLGSRAVGLGVNHHRRALLGFGASLRGPLLSRETCPNLLKQLFQGIPCLSVTAPPAAGCGRDQPRRQARLREAAGLQPIGRSHALRSAGRACHDCPRPPLPGDNSAPRHPRQHGGGHRWSSSSRIRHCIASKALSHRPSASALRPAPHRTQC